MMEAWLSEQPLTGGKPRDEWWYFEEDTPLSEINNFIDEMNAKEPGKKHGNQIICMGLMGL
jgi:hypothetical protein